MRISVCASVCCLNLRIKLYYTTADLRWQLNHPSKRPRIDQVSVSGISRCSVDSSYVRLSNDLGPNQVCTLFGSKGGSTLISGKDYIAAGYGFDHGDLWRRCLPVLFVLTVAFQTTQIIALEFFPVGAEPTFLISTDPVALTATWRQPVALYICQGDRRTEAKERSPESEKNA